MHLLSVKLLTSICMAECVVLMHFFAKTGAKRSGKCYDNHEVICDETISLFGSVLCGVLFVGGILGQRLRKCRFWQQQFNKQSAIRLIAPHRKSPTILRQKPLLKAVGTLSKAKTNCKW